MARPLRIEFPGAVYYITYRGNAKQSIYLDEEDRNNFLKILTSVVQRFNWLCHAYCLMENHYHLIIETPEGNLSRAMRQLNDVYTQNTYLGVRYANISRTIKRVEGKRKSKKMQ